MTCLRRLPILKSSSSRAAAPVGFLLLLVALGVAVPAGAATLIVTSSSDVAADDGACTLREAIVAANTNVASGLTGGECAAGDAGADRIEFALAGDTPTIVVGAALPTIVEPLAIDGGTGGATRVELNGAGAMSSGLVIAAGDSIVRSLVINRFAGSGIYLTSDGNRIENCFVGTDASGGVDLGNGQDGVVIQLGEANVVGGTAAGAGNLISGNGSRGVEISLGGTDNRIEGNRIGTDAAGTLDLGNDDVGVLIFEPGNVVGGLAAGAGNVISGNGAAGVRIDGADATGNLVQGNFIGTDATGAVALGNGNDGVLIAFAAADNVIGGTAAGAGNLISGNGARGVSISAGATANVVAGNLIGIDASGVAALGNVTDGIGLLAPGNTVGGDQLGAGNVVSGNGRPSGSGVYVDALAASSVVQGNLIGTDATGMAALPNAFNGVQIRGANGVLGGPGAARNVISGNATSGVLLTASASGNVVTGNLIGTAADGVAPLGNGRDGVTLGSSTTGPASGNVIGGTSAAAGNVIAFNARDGVRVTSGNGNAILSNAIHANTGLGIDLGGNGVTANDAGSPPDADVGANDLQNFPVLGEVSSAGATTKVSGTLASAPGSTFRVQLFASPACDGTHGEGRTLLGETSVTTDASGAATIDALLPSVAGVGHVVTATATAPNGSTSEFSSCATVVAGVVEDCWNCVDDDGNGLVDRADPQCPAPANGSGLGLGDAARGKRIDRCGKTLQASGATYVKKRLARTRACTDLVLACVQQKPGDARCLAKADASCGRVLAKLVVDRAKLSAAVVKDCSPPDVSADDLRDVQGLGYDVEDAACSAVGGAPPVDVTAIADCVARRHDCRSDQLLALQVPRAAELLTLAGRTPAVERPCLGTGSDGAGTGIGDGSRAKLAVACGKALEKAGATFVTGEQTAVQGCLRALTKCLQAAPGNAACIAKARQACVKQVGKLDAPVKGAAAKLAASIEKACGKPGLILADVLDASGLGFATHVSHCAALGVAGITSAADVGECLRRQHVCRAEQLLEAQTPRLRELIELGGTPLP